MYLSRETYTNPLELLYISIFQKYLPLEIINFSFYASDELVNPVSAFLILFYYALSLKRFWVFIAKPL